jgi:hypothetical protein
MPPDDGGAMLFSILVCSDDGCDAVYEAWCEDRELESLACELCGCALQAVAFSNPSTNGVAPKSFEIQLRDAA